jgi:hypothetical protein
MSLRRRVAVALTVLVLGLGGAAVGALPASAATVVVGPGSLPNATVAQAYSTSFSASGGTPPYTFAQTAGALPSGLGVSSAGVLSGTPTTSGTFTFTITATDSSSTDLSTGSRTYTLTVAAPTIVVSPATLPSATQGSAYTQSLSASGGIAPYSFAVTAGSVPPGTSLTSTGTLTGTPTAAGTYTFTVRADDQSGSSGARAYSLTVRAEVLVLDGAQVPPATVGVPYAGSVTAHGGTAPYTYFVSAGSLPAGLGLVPSTGAITGRPTAAGTSAFTVTVTDAFGAGATRSLTITTAPPVLTVRPTPLPAPVLGTTYRQQLDTTGGSGLYSYVVSSGALPAGLTLDSGGLLTGVPSAAGVATFAITSTDSAGFSTTVPETLTVAPPVTATVTNSDPHAGDAVDVSASGLASGPVTVAIDTATTSIGTGLVGTDGSLSFTGTLPASTAPGTHRVLLVRNGVVVGSGTVTVVAAAVSTPPTVPTIPIVPAAPAASAATPPTITAGAGVAGVAVQPGSTGPRTALASTGSDPVPSLAVAMLVLLLGAGTSTIARRRRTSGR